MKTVLEKRDFRRNLKIEKESMRCKNKKTGKCYTPEIVYEKKERVPKTEGIFLLTHHSIHFFRFARYT